MPEGDATVVFWAMHGPSPNFAKAIHELLNMDRRVGTDVETGRADLKAPAGFASRRR